MENKIRILIADDHPIVREGMKQIISKADDLIVEAEALNGLEVIEQVSKSDFDIVILDVSMPGQDGLDVLREIKTMKPKLPVLILSVYPEEHIALRAFKLGASGYLNKDAAPKELVNAIRKITSGGKFITPSLVDKLVDSLSNNDSQDPLDSLSDREFQVLRLIAGGKSADEIADYLFISVKTVRTYRDRILDKLNLKNDVEIARFAIKNKIVKE